MGTRVGLRTLLLTACNGALLLLAACGEAASKRETFSAPQLLTQIEKICLDEAEESRLDLRGQFECDAQCYAELTLIDAAVCKCQRQRLERDFSAEELQRVAILTKADHSLRALREEGVDATSPLVLDHDSSRVEAVRGLSPEKTMQLSGAYSDAHNICSDEETAKSVVRAR